MQKTHGSGEGREVPLLGSLMFFIYAYSSGGIRRIIRWLVLKLEKGEIYSLTIRKIFKKYHSVEVGMYSDGAAFVLHSLPVNTVVGRYSTLTDTMRAFNANHPMNIKSTNALFYNSKLGIVSQDLIERPPLQIGNDVFIGHNVVILPSVRSIGDGAVIGAGSVVQRDVPPYAVVVGHPAVLVRYRFGKETIKQLLESEWWKKPLGELKSHLSEFQVPLEDDGPVR